MSTRIPSIAYGAVHEDAWIEAEGGAWETPSISAGALNIGSMNSQPCDNVCITTTAHIGSSNLKFTISMAVATVYVQHVAFHAIYACIRTVCRARITTGSHQTQSCWCKFTFSPPESDVSRKRIIPAVLLASQTSSLREAIWINFEAGGTRGFCWVLMWCRTSIHVPPYLFHGNSGCGPIGSLRRIFMNIYHRRWRHSASLMYYNNSEMYGHGKQVYWFD